jgi:hypothetical protein
VRCQAGGQIQTRLRLGLQDTVGCQGVRADCSSTSSWPSPGVSHADPAKLVPVQLQMPAPVQLPPFKQAGTQAVVHRAAVDWNEAGDEQKTGRKHAQSNRALVWHF